MDIIDSFIRNAESCCGKSGYLYQRRYGISKNGHWSSAFVSYLSENMGLKSVVPVSSIAQSMIDKGTTSLKHTGTWVPRTRYGVVQVPQPGDLIFLVEQNDSERANKVGIVKSYDSDTQSVKVILGDYGDLDPARSSVRMTSFDSSFGCIKGYFRPDWGYV